jgi:type 1 glutamine amidotransferase
MFARSSLFLFGILGAIGFPEATAKAEDAKGKIRVVVIDGQHNHAWRDTTAFLKEVLERNGRFAVDVSSNLKAGDKPGKVSTVAFPPDLTKYQVVISNYNGPAWPVEFRGTFEERVREGKLGFFLFHSANNCFSDWPEFNRMVGLAWRGPKFGDRIYIDEKGGQVRIPKGEGGGTSETNHPYAIVLRKKDHPICMGMPEEWMHAKDQLMFNLRGPAEEIQVLATALCPKTMVHEPVLWTVAYGKGRVVQTPMGHDVFAMRCVGFISTMERSLEWAATGKVTVPIPGAFPSPANPSQVEAGKK